MVVSDEYEYEQYQQQEDERLEYEGYCNKIRKGLEDLDEKSSERAIWELIQNARDMSNDARIKIELTDQNIIFAHHGKPFDYTSFISLVKQDSSKDRNGADSVGQYGTGFMTTHAFNRKVYVSGPFEAKKRNDIVGGYVYIKDFELDRTSVDTPEGITTMKAQLDIVKNFWKGALQPDIQDDTTSFRYELDIRQVEEISKQFNNVTRLMPFVLVINERIKEVEIYNHHTHEHYVLSRTNQRNVDSLNYNNWNLITDKILLSNFEGEIRENFEIDCKSLQSSNGDVIIIPPYPELCGDVNSIPSLFLWFPLLGTENFGVNFIFHSKRFYPVEKRNNIMLPESTPLKKEMGGRNEKVLREMMDVLFVYYGIAENAHTLSREMCTVQFPQNCEDEETQTFYNGMQECWKQEIVKWEIIPVGNSFYSIHGNNGVALLHPDFYKTLTAEQKDNYEHILIKYASFPKQKDGITSYLMPSTDLIAWSETVYQWGCNDNNYFITVEEVCESIKTKSEDLHSFLLLMCESGNLKVMETYPLVPNREGTLCRKNELCNANFMTKEKYDIVKVIMGDDVNKMIDPEFLDVCSVSDYTIVDLQKAITSTISGWRKDYIADKKAIPKEYLYALINFCSVRYSSESTNVRLQMMPLITKFLGVENTGCQVQRFREDNEEDFYTNAFNFLLDYTLLQIDTKDSSWVADEENKVWLKSFLTLYSPKTNTDHQNRLDLYRVLPNQNSELCLMKDLVQNMGVPEQLADIYQTIFNNDLHSKWIDPQFECLIDLDKDTPTEVATKVERTIVEDMKEETNRRYDKEVRDIILKIAESQDWKMWFNQIDEKKAKYIFNMKSGDAQKSLFSLMDISDATLGRLAQVAEIGNIEKMLDTMERLQQKELDDKARFNHLHAIGKHIENVLRERIKSGIFEVKTTQEQDASADDMQNGQDIVIRVNKSGEWKEVYYIEVKSKWDFSEPAHMSTCQIRKATCHPDCYALCCVDLRDYRNEDLINLSEEVIIGSTKVKLDIGKQLGNMVQNILTADNYSDDVQIKISDYRSNMSAKVFSEGETIDGLISEIEEHLNTELKV
ncbi:MAG: sacsin N-terminal ATP-binding-like domain-containing protein [Paludibacteraceae bacterium]